MKYAEIQHKGERELRDTIAQKRAELRDLRFKASAGGLKNTSAIRNAKNVIARALTALNAKEADAAKQQEQPSA